MTTTQHTQGPWDYDCYGERFSFFGNDGREDYSFRIEYNEEMPEAEQLENSHLIAAAPELLDVVKRIYAIWDDPDRSPSELADSVDRDWIRAAIAKAEGRAE